jgi:hypothetical protein
LFIASEHRNSAREFKQTRRASLETHSDLKPKPSYLAIQKLTRELSGFHLEKRIPLPGDKDHALLFKNDAGKAKIAAWTLAAPHEVKVPLAAKDVSLNLTADPQYFAIEAAAGR